MMAFYYSTMLEFSELFLTTPVTNVCKGTQHGWLLDVIHL